MIVDNGFFYSTALGQLALFLLYIFSRVIGLFILSPFLSNATISVNVRIFLAFSTAVLLGMVLYPEFFGPEAKFLLPNVQLNPFAMLIYVAMLCLKEVAVGYLIGFFFNIMFEAMMFVGELIDSLIGFSTSQFIDPFSNTFQTLMGQLLVMFAAMLMIILDLHHIFIRMVTWSFDVIPLGDFRFNQDFLTHVIQGMSLIFLYTLKLVTVPLIILACGIWGIGCTVRVVPEMNLLATGLPMRILIGYLSLIIALGFMVVIFQEGFQEIIQLVNITLQNP